MRIIADLHIHSRYARATSKNSDLEGLSEWAKIKGISLLATGDFTHPEWFGYLRNNLEDLGNGIYKYRDIHYVIGGEISLIYERDGKTKKMHVVLLCPSFETAEQISELLGKFGNLSEDGRPTLKMDPMELIDAVDSVSKDIFVILAHIWTPWFSVFGSKSGVDSIEEAFGEKSERIGALETGLSSDTKMNWMVSRIDKYALVSNSDAHSPQKLGREANLLELEKLNYMNLAEAIKNKKGIVKTYEFYPEEGKYHYDGHRNCGVVMSPEEAEKNKNICPVCRRKLTIGVMHRVYDLADREYSYTPGGAPGFQYIVPLSKVISKALKVGETSQRVNEEYFRLIRYFGNEFSVYEADEEKLRLACSPEIADSIIRVNKGNIYWNPGYDGVFGDFSFEKKAEDRKNQKSLLDF
ncbi:DNA helicase UvrD [Candidatus Micrarchaeota archaeon]|nr:DNA helicase UvrD [Candidatus Micrarchaeota archaeon]